MFGAILFVLSFGAVGALAGFLHAKAMSAHPAVLLA